MFLCSRVIFVVGRHAGRSPTTNDPKWNATNKIATTVQKRLVADRFLLLNSADLRPCQLGRPMENPFAIASLDRDPTNAFYHLPYRTCSFQTSIDLGWMPETYLVRATHRRYQIERHRQPRARHFPSQIQLEGRVVQERFHHCRDDFAWISYYFLALRC